MRRTLNRWLVISPLVALLGACETGDPLDPGPGTVPVATVQVTPKEGAWTGTVNVGHIVELKAKALAADGTELSGRQVEWTSSDSAIATVTGTGLVTGRGPGMATLSAKIGGSTGTVSVQVVIPDSPPAAVAQVIVTPGALVLPIGQARQYAAQALDANGNELHGRAVTWSTSAAGVVSVSQAGVVVALASGYADVIATVEGKSAAVGVTVPAPEPVPLIEASLRTVAGNSLPALLRTFKVTNEQGVEVTRTIRVLAGNIKIDLATERYQQQVTLQYWEDAVLKETRTFNDTGYVAPLFSGSGTLVFRSNVYASLQFNGFETANGFEVTQRVINAGDPVVLRYAR